MEANTKVYVLEIGCYSEKWLAGVYSTPEKAMAEAGGEWRQWNDEEYWTNNLDWQDHASITAVIIDAN